ncbi:hypothetical protein CANCADRAFT_81962 [Tortispora caseinolytica NRRL Y-17796]|uniref:Uncharacterized protein n=1 Tax=Tortispora caseinolytica NRRL Y-17796 TaxID=767744 RepID=A0A1E4TJX9_9ASCO|nr:hypothetical protein CANCADRAFT_81962 [Tortispora caseinolytica NRRL Y-17796]
MCIAPHQFRATACQKLISSGRWKSDVSNTARLAKLTSRLFALTRDPNELRSIISSQIQHQKSITLTPEESFFGSGRKSKSENNSKDLPSKSRTESHYSDDLYVPTRSMSFQWGDFVRLVPSDTAKEIFQKNEAHDLYFQLRYSRANSNMLRRFGYFLSFKPNMAAKFLELVRLKNPAPQINSQPIVFLNSHLPRDNKCYLNRAQQEESWSGTVLMYGLPSAMPHHAMIQLLTDYELIDNELKAIEKLPFDEFSGSLWLVRTKSASAAYAIHRDFHMCPHNDQNIFVDIVEP